MPDLLLLGNDRQAAFELEELAKGKGFRVKTTYESQTAADWLKQKEFDLVWAYAELPVEKQQLLAGLLWKSNPLAPFVIFDLDAKGRQETRNAARLFGAEVASGADSFK